MIFERKPCESDKNVKTTCEKGGREPPNFTLDYIFNDLLSYIGKSPHLNKTYTNIEKKYDIKKESGCWPEDDIKRAWGKTQRMGDTSLKKKRWSLAIMLQVIKKQNFNGCIGKEAQPDESNEKAHEKKKGEGSNKPNSQSVYIRIPISVMFKNESTSQRGGGSGEKDSPTYKLIDRFPFLNEVKKKKSYVVEYNNQTRNAAWVYEILNRETVPPEVKDKDENEDKDEDDKDKDKNVAATGSRNKNSFKYKNDTTLPLYEAAKNIEECDESDYERGHLASAANHKWCQEAYEDTFFLSNIAPQVPAFNQGLWKKLEDHCKKKLYSQNDISNVHVYSGPLYLLSDDKKKGNKLKTWKSKVVPTHFFKVIIVEHINGKVELECYEMPNETPKDKNDQSENKNSQSKNKNSQSKNKNSQSKNKNNESKGKNNQSKVKNNQSKDDDENLKIYSVPIKQIETDSGLRFTESSCTEGEIDSKRKVKWEGKDADGKPCSAKIKVTISTPLTDHNDFVYI